MPPDSPLLPEVPRVSFARCPYETSTGFDHSRRAGVPASGRGSRGSRGFCMSSFCPKHFAQPSFKAHEIPERRSRLVVARFVRVPHDRLRRGTVDPAER